MTKKVGRYQYGVRHRGKDIIVQMSLSDIRYMEKTTNMTYVLGERYRRVGRNGQWEKM